MAHIPFHKGQAWYIVVVQSGRSNAVWTQVKAHHLVSFQSSGARMASLSTGQDQGGSIGPTPTVYASLLRKPLPPYCLRCP